MDYRLRKYYFVSFSCVLYAYDMRLDIIKQIPSIKISSPYLDCTKVVCGNRCGDYREMHDKIIKRIGFRPQMIVSCRKEYSEQLEYELNKAVRRDRYAFANSYFCEITKDLVGQ